MAQINRIFVTAWSLIELSDVFANTEFGVFKNAERVQGDLRQRRCTA